MSEVFSQRVLEVTEQLITPMVIGEMFGPKARVWYEKWSKSLEFKQIVSAERMAATRMRQQHPSIHSPYDKRTHIGKQLVADKKRLYETFEKREGPMPSDTNHIRLMGRLTGIGAS